MPGQSAGRRLGLGHLRQALVTGNAVARYLGGPAWNLVASSICSNCWRQLPRCRTSWSRPSRNWPRPRSPEQAGGGLVTAVVNGQGELVDLAIAPEAIDAADPQETAQTISDLVLAAYRDACRVVDELQEQTMAPFAAGLGGGGFPGLLGGGPGGPGQPGGPGEPGPAGLPPEADRPAEDED